MNWRLTSEPAALSKGSPNIRKQLNLPFFFDLKIPEIPYALPKYAPIRTSQCPFSISAQPPFKLSIFQCSPPALRGEFQLICCWVSFSSASWREGGKSPQHCTPQRGGTPCFEPLGLFLAGNWKNNAAAWFGRALAPWGSAQLWRHSPGMGSPLSKG